METRCEDCSWHSRSQFRLLPAWTTLRSDGNVTTAQFVVLAEQISGAQLDRFFRDWLFTPTKPPAPADAVGQ